ncbi:MAG: hypothetical protein ACREEY_05245 [Brevundimonas sp.]
MKPSKAWLKEGPSASASPNQVELALFPHLGRRPNAQPSFKKRRYCVHLDQMVFSARWTSKISMK